MLTRKYLVEDILLTPKIPNMAPSFFLHNIQWMYSFFTTKLVNNGYLTSLY